MKIRVFELNPQIFSPNSSNTPILKNSRTMNEYGAVDASFLNASWRLVAMMIPPCIKLIPVLIFFNLLYAYSRAFFFEGDMRIDYGFLVKGVAIWLFVAFYGQMMGMANNLVNHFVGAFPHDGNVLDSMSKLSDQMAQINGSDLDLGLVDIHLPFKDFPTFMFWLTSIIEQGLTMMIRIFVDRTRGIILAFMMAVGPLAFTLSLFPGMDGLRLHWFKAWLSVSFWNLTLGLLDSLVVTYQQTMVAQFGTTPAFGEGISNGIELVVVNIVIIAMYLSVPMLTSLYINSHAAGQLLGSAGRMAGAVMANSTRAGAAVAQAGAGAVPGVARAGVQAGKVAIGSSMMAGQWAKKQYDRFKK